MIVAFSIGAKSKKVINTLRSSADNIEFYTYSSLQDNTKAALQRHITFDRIVFSTAILSNDTEADLRELNDFIKNYSNSTELVMLISPDDLNKGIDKVFNGMFNSPLYTPVIMEKGTAKGMLEIIRGDITSLKMKYYTLDVNKDRTIVSSSSESATESEKQEVVEDFETKKKKGGIRAFFGGSSKNAAKNDKQISVESNPSEDTVSTGETVTNATNESTVQNVSEPTMSGGQSSGNLSSDENQPKNIFGFSDFGSPVSGSSSVGSEFSAEDNPDDMLSIGSYGKEHVDTGFLDEESEEELKKYVESRNSGSSADDGGIVRDEQPSRDVVSREPVREVGREANREVNREEVTRSERAERVVEQVREDRVEIKSEPKSYSEMEDYRKHIDLVLGVKGSGATASIVDEAVRMSQEGFRVLIVDLDTQYSGLLSYIDVSKYYMSGCFNGISKLRVYSEDNVDIISEGYGCSVSSDMVMSLLRSSLLSNYNIVFIDCPLESISCLSEGIISMCNVLIMSGSDISDFISTSIALTDRGKVSLEMEKAILEKCSVEINGQYATEDVDSVSEMCLFANGNWLQKV